MDPAMIQLFISDVDDTLNNTRSGVAASERARIRLQSVAAAGDGENDIAMFRESGFTVAMGQASPELQRAACCEAEVSERHKVRSSEHGT